MGVSELSLLPRPQRGDDEVALEGRSVRLEEEVSGAPRPWKRTRLALVFVIVGCRDACSALSAVKKRVHLKGFIIFAVFHLRIRK